MNAPTAIETEYAGHLFRSRLEARWAVFFTALGIEWKYEPQGYYVGDERVQRHTYLPDFYLPTTGTWVEVKGDVNAFDWQLLADAVDWGRGLPGIEDSIGTARGLLLLGDVPNLTGPGLPIHPILQHYKGGAVNGACVVHRAKQCPDVAVVRRGSRGGLGDPSGFDSTDRNGLGPLGEEMVRILFKGDHFDREARRSKRVGDAYRAARSARFEHGQVGGMLPAAPRSRRPW